MQLEAMVLKVVCDLHTHLRGRRSELLPWTAFDCSDPITLLQLRDSSVFHLTTLISHESLTALHWRLHLHTVDWYSALHIV